MGSYTAFIALSFLFLFAPLLVTRLLAFNNSDFPFCPGMVLPWTGSSRPIPAG